MSTLQAQPVRRQSTVDYDGAGLSAAPYSQMARVTHTSKVDQHIPRRRLAMGAEGTYYNNGHIVDRMFDMIFPDLVLQRSGAAETFATGNRTGHYQRVFGCMNGLRENPAEDKELVVQKYRLAGVAQGGAKFKGDVPNQEHIATTVGGSVSLFNNGPTHIFAGDELWWDIPDRDENGNAVGFVRRPDDPPGKIPAVVIKRYDPTVHAPSSKALLEAEYRKDSANLLSPDKRGKNNTTHYFDCIVRMTLLLEAGEAASGEQADEVIAMYNDANRRQRVFDALTSRNPIANADEYNRLFGNFFAEFVTASAAYQSHITGRKFAKATSNCPPGKRVDVTLGSYRMT